MFWFEQSPARVGPVRSRLRTAAARRASRSGRLTSWAVIAWASMSFAQTTADTKPVAQIPAGATSTTSATPIERPSEGGSRAGATMRTVGLVVGGVGVAGIVVFAVTGLMASSTFNGLRADCPNGCSDPGHLEQIDRGHSLQTTANIALAAGSIGLGTGAVLFFLGLDQDRNTNVSVSPSDGGGIVSYRTRF